MDGAYSFELYWHLTKTNKPVNRFPCKLLDNVTNSPIFKTKCSTHFFHRKLYNNWNLLPQTVFKSRNLNSFNSGIDNFLVKTYIYIYIIQILCVCVSVKYRRPNGWTDHDQIWHVYADRPGNGSYQKKWSHVWSGRVGSLGPFFEAGT